MCVACVWTVAGGAGFGLVDGAVAIAKLYHPEAVAVLGPDDLIIADTYNSWVRRVSARCRSLAAVAVLVGRVETSE